MIILEIESCKYLTSAFIFSEISTLKASWIIIGFKRLEQRPYYRIVYGPFDFTALMDHQIWMSHFGYDGAHL